MSVVKDDTYIYVYRGQVSWDSRSPLVGAVYKWPSHLIFAGEQNM